MTGTSVYADFHNADPSGRVRLNLHGTAQDLKALSMELCDGLRLTLSDGELSVEGVVRFSGEEQIWVAEIDWNEIVDRE